ncbi:DUF397 domain-containing protein [Nocardia nova]|nr:DUF397 domain-containing protein [Nocardia nova]
MQKVDVSVWFKSTFSDHGNACVEVRICDHEVLVRDSKYVGDVAAQPMIAVRASRWHEFLETVAGRGAGGKDGLPLIDYRNDGSVSLSAGTVTLTYTRPEWDAFRDGIEHNEFDSVPSAA